MPRRTTPLFVVYSGEDLEGPVYRAVAHCPPRLDDFRSYEALGMPYAPRQHFRATGVSMFTDRGRLQAHIQAFGLPRSIATVDLRTADVVWTRSARSTHVTIWAPAFVLLEQVVQCDENG